MSNMKNRISVVAHLSSVEGISSYVDGQFAYVQLSDLISDAAKSLAAAQPKAA